MVYTVLGTILKSLHTCVFDFSRLAKSAFIMATLVSMVMRSLLLDVFEAT